MSFQPFRRPPRARIFMILAFGALAIMVAVEIVDRLESAGRTRQTWDRFLTDLSERRIERLTIDRPMVAYDTTRKTAFDADEQRDVAIPPMYYVEWPPAYASETALSEVNAAIAKAEQARPEDRIPFRVERSGAPTKPAPWLDTLVSFLFLGLIGLMVWQYMPMFKTTGKRVSKEDVKIRFPDVAGIDEAKSEVAEVVEFLKDPGRFRRLGARPPRGIILVGPPGTGKTMLAKAVAGEADVPFFAASGSDFVELYVGLGARRVRSLFEQARMWSPCVIFIDEIDAIGKKRGSDGGGHSEMDQTLNALLTCMDGMTTDKDIVVLAATNRVDVLDAALTRPGRFDRHVHVGLPDVHGRERILQVHIDKLTLEPGVSMTNVAKTTPGFSGADLANLVNEAAVIAGRHRRASVTQGDFDAARDRVAYGQERRLAMQPDERRRIAIHEAGHAILQVAVGTDQLHKVSIIPRGLALGSTMMLPEQDRRIHTAAWMTDQICMLLGGRAAEQLVLGDISSGASDDIRRASSIAKTMVAEFGMSAAGLLAWDERQGMTVDDATRSAVHTAASDILKTQDARATSILMQHQDTLAYIVEQLLAVETVDGADIVARVRPTASPATPNASVAGS